MNDETYLIIGGDKRQEFLFNILKSKNINVDRILFNDTKNIAEEILKIQNSKIIVLPIPTTKDGKTLNAPFLKETIPLELIIDNVNQNSILFTGGEKNILKQAKVKKIINLLEDESLTLKNAMATAEATLAIIIQNTTKTIFGSKILITGYGRIGEILSNYLISLKANVTVYARRKESRVKSKLLGAEALDFNDLKTTLSYFDIIINTIPTLIFKKEEIETINKNALIIDLASKPGGIDYNIAKKLNLNVIHALSLPGIFSPESAAEFIEQTIKNELT